VLEFDKLFDKNLEHIGEALQQTPRAYAVRAEAALEECANLTFVVDVEERQQRINEQKADANEDTLNGSCQPSGHE
jgi:predicted DNA-binding protein